MGLNRGTRGEAAEVSQTGLSTLQHQAFHCLQVECLSRVEVQPHHPAQLGWHGVSMQAVCKEIPYQTIALQSVSMKAFVQPSTTGNPPRNTNTVSTGSVKTKVSCCVYLKNYRCSIRNRPAKPLFEACKQDKWPLWVCQSMIRPMGHIAVGRHRY